MKKMIGSLAIISITIVVVLLLCIPFLVLSFALITIIRNYIINYKLTSTTTSTSSIWSRHNSCIYAGRVSHVRFDPIHHSFSYPLFLMYLDLDEIDILFDAQIKGALWPLNLITSFRESDHLKNNEGIDNDDTITIKATFSDRIRALVYKKTNGKCNISKDKHKIYLLTHLCYFGYCFNPVSFYYIFDENGELEVIVAEVSNTPWLEMKCYVLHSDSIDMVKVKVNVNRKANDSASSVNYIFPKSFHVSPFMSMDYMYDWTFWKPTTISSNINPNNSSQIIKVSTTMIKSNTNIKAFNAFFKLTRVDMSPMNLSYQLLRLPCYCIIIQIWIHVEAFWLFLKGVTFIPHPEEKETFVSSVIAAVMVPFFKIKGCWLDLKKEKCD